MTTPATVLAVSGQLVDEDTGEILDVGSSDLLGSLDTLHKAHRESELARLEYEARLAALMDADPILAGLVGRRLKAEAVILDIEGALSRLRPSEDPLRSFTLDVGTVRVTWPKASERWTQVVSPHDIALNMPDLAERLGVERVVGNPPKPRITVRKFAESNGSKSTT